MDSVLAQRRPVGPKGGLYGLKLEVGAQRAPGPLFGYIWMYFDIFLSIFVNRFSDLAALTASFHPEEARRHLQTG